MTNEQILDFNKLCAEFLKGFPYVKRLHDDEYIYHVDKSKTPIEQQDNEFHEKINAHYYHNGIYMRLGYYIDLDELRFNTDWNWLMTVKEKITNLGYPFFIFPDSICITKNRTISSPKITKVEFNKPEDEMKALVETIYNFLIWYNDTRTKNQ